MSEKNMSLLSQSEIDALINFLNEKKDNETIGGDTLSQSNINKLIELVKSIPSLDKNVLLNTAAIETGSASFFTNLADKEGYELTFKCSSDGQISLFACNIETDDAIAITPNMLSNVKFDDAPETWGSCMAPATFDRIAKTLSLNYSDESLNKLKALFAEKMYGSAEVVIPAFYLP